MTLTYNVAKDQEALPPKERTIEKHGHLITFSLKQVEDHKVELEKHLKELTAKRAYEKAKMTNIEEHHEYVKGLDAEKLFTIHMYQDANALVKVCEEKIKEVEDQIEEYDKEVKDILNQVPEVGDQVPAIAVEDTKDEGK